jgi:hypothetical protein
MREQMRMSKKVSFECVGWIARSLVEMRVLYFQCDPLFQSAEADEIDDSR